LKTANEFTCSMFGENLRAFIDNELPINQRSAFLDHASKCNKCNRELLYMQHVKKELAGLRRVTVSPEFDFKMKSLVRHEHEKLRSSLYSFRLFISENSNKFIVAPVFALLILVGMVFYNNSNNRETTTILPDVVTSLINAENGVEIIPENNNSSVEEVNYVLETVKPTDMERRIFLHEPDGTVQSIPINNDLTLVSF